MHPDLKAFAASYRHRFPDLTITTMSDGLIFEWQEAPKSPCYTVEVYANSEGVTVFESSVGFIDADPADFLDAVVTAMRREREVSDRREAILAAPGSFAALVLMHATLRGLPVPPPARPMSPDRLN